MWFPRRGLVINIPHCFFIDRIYYGSYMYMKAMKSSKMHELNYTITQVNWLKQHPALHRLLHIATSGLGRKQ